MPTGLATEIGICSCDIAHVVQAEDTSRECKCSVVRPASVKGWCNRWWWRETCPREGSALFS